MVNILTSLDKDNLKLSDNEAAMAIHQEILQFFDEWKTEFEHLTSYSELKDFFWNKIKRSEQLSNLLRQELQLFKTY